MNEILAKCNELYAELVKERESVRNEALRLKNEKEELLALRSRINTKEIDVLERAKKVKKLEGIVGLDAQLNDKGKELTAREDLVAEKEKDVAKREKTADKREAAIEKMKALYIKKDKLLDDDKKKLERERKEMRKTILEELKNG